jgi:hypothetical protein
LATPRFPPVSNATRPSSLRPAAFRDPGCSKVPPASPRSGLWGQLGQMTPNISAQRSGPGSASRTIPAGSSPRISPQAQFSRCSATSHRIPIRSRGLSGGEDRPGEGECLRRLSGASLCAGAQPSHSLGRVLASIPPRHGIYAQRATPCPTTDIQSQIGRALGSPTLRLPKRPRDLPATQVRLDRLVHPCPFHISQARVCPMLLFAANQADDTKSILETAPCSSKSTPARRPSR